MNSHSRITRWWNCGALHGGWLRTSHFVRAVGHWFYMDRDIIWGGTEAENALSASHSSYAGLQLA
ncbi:MAG: hypothetical protein M3Q16_09205 [Pseudomonadota bacterium]|nr:hypothetical protein [Pseudomonadota bacterium]